MQETNASKLTVILCSLRCFKPRLSEIWPNLTEMNIENLNIWPPASSECIQMQSMWTYCGSMGDFKCKLNTFFYPSLISREELLMSVVKRAHDKFILHMVRQEMNVGETVATVTPVWRLIKTAHHSSTSSVNETPSLSTEAGRGKRTNSSPGKDLNKRECHWWRSVGLDPKTALCLLSSALIYICSFCLITIWESAAGVLCCLHNMG